MKLKPKTSSKAFDISGLPATELLSMVEGLQQELVAKNAAVQQRDSDNAAVLPANDQTCAS